MPRTSKAMAVLVKREAALQEQARSLKSEMDAVLRTMGELQAIIREMQAAPKRVRTSKRAVVAASLNRDVGSTAA